VIKVLHKKTSQKGSSLIEILVAVMVMATVLTAVVAGLTISIKTTAESKYRSLAIKKNQEAVEVFRREHTLLGWDAFKATLGAGGSICLATLPEPPTQFSITGECDVEDSDDVLSLANIDYIREALVDTTTSPAIVTVTVNTSWQNGERDVEVTQEFYRTE